MTSDHWLKTAPDTPLRDLVDGLDTIGVAPIPYARMPARARTAFGAEFTTWADIADETVQSLLTRRHAGHGTIKVLIAAAEDTVTRYQVPADIERAGPAAATQRLLDELDDTELVMLAGHVWGLRKRTKQDIGDQLGVNPVWVSRHLPRSAAKFAELLTDPAHHEVREYASDLAVQLGSYAPARAVTDALAALGAEAANMVGQVLLYVAGPYIPAGDWFETPGAQERAADAAAALFALHGAPAVTTVHQALEQLGMTAAIAAAYASSHLPVRVFDAKYIPWGDTPTDRAEAALHMHGTPVTVEEMLSTIGGDIDIAKTALRAMLFNEHRFVRVSRRRWGLRAWNVEEYRGIADTIGTRIDRAGGSAPMSELIADIAAAIPDVAESSIAAYMHTLAFVIKDGSIRRRKPGDRWPKVPDVNTVRGTFRNGDNEIRLSFPVDHDLLRGSGVALPAAAAAALGVKPSRERTYAGPHFAVRVKWPLASTPGARVGSLRRPAEAVSAKLGDILVLAFTPKARTVHVEVISATSPVGERLRRHLGRRDVTEAGLSHALNCHPEQIEDVLRKRGDDILADHACSVLSQEWSDRSA